MKEITLKSEVNNFPQAVEFVKGYLEENDVPFEVIIQLKVAIDEVFSNICFYAYEEPGDVKVSIDITDNPKSVELVFYDWGVPYDPLNRDDPDVTLSVEERQIGGLGILMVKKSMDQMIYSYENGQNILRLVKTY